MLRSVHMLMIILGMTAYGTSIGVVASGETPSEAQAATPPQTRDDLIRERMALEHLIQDTKQQISKYLTSAADLNQLAAQARRDRMYTSASAFSAQAAQFRELATEAQASIAKARQRINEINAALNRR